MKPGSFVLLPIVSLLLLAGFARGAEPDLADEILKMTGARTKIVWQHEVLAHDGDDGYGWIACYELRGFDTVEGISRVILPGPASYGDPWITPDGERIVYTEGNGKGGVIANGIVWVVDWAGTSKRKLLDNGRALAVWQHPTDGSIWVYAVTAGAGSTIFRFRLDDPKVLEVVFTKALLYLHNQWRSNALRRGCQASCTVA